MAPTTQNHRALVLDADMTPALTIARSLQRRGIPVDVAAATPRPLAGHSLAADQVYLHPDPLVDEQGFVAWLAARLDHTSYSLVIPVTERSVVPLAKHRARLGASCIALASDNALEAVLDKDRTLALARELGIPAPRSLRIDHAGQIEQHAGTLQFPVVVKPARSFGARDTQRTQLSVDYAFDQNQLHAKARHALQYGAVLLQEYVGGQGVGIELIADRGEIAYTFQHRRLHEIPLTGGGSSLRVSEAPNPALVEASRKLMRALGWHGVAMVEFKHDPRSGAFSLMEINGRFWGSLPLAVAAGADFPAMLYELMVEGAIQPRPPARTGLYGRNLARDLYWVELALRRAGPARLVTFPTRKQILKDTLLIFSPRHRFDVQQWRDPWPGLVDIWRTLAALAARLRDLIAERWLARKLQKRRTSSEVPARLRKARQVLFVCYGNINRSPLAEQYFRTKTTGMPIACLSAGFHEETGRPADPTMIELAQARGIDLAQSRSTHINKGLLSSSDMIFVMEQQQYRRIEHDYPEVAERTYLLSARGNIDDPYGKSPEHYSRCLDEIVASINQLTDPKR